VVYPTVAEMRGLIQAEAPDNLVRRYVFGELPYVFKANPPTYETLKEHLRDELGVSVDNITIVGSAKAGYSLAPDTFPRKFAKESDIDVVVVDARLFDDSWETLLTWNYPRRRRLPQAEWRWARNRQDDLYWGWFSPHRIRFEGLSFPESLQPLRNLATAWFAAFRSLSRYPELAGREVSGRLYRSWDHALLYHVDGMRRLARRLAG